MGLHVQHGKLVMGALDIVGVPAFSDNYLWLVHDSASGETAVAALSRGLPVNAIC